MKQLLAATLLVAVVAVTGCGEKKPAAKPAAPAAGEKAPAKPAEPAKTP
jgi:hypothetical protein